MLSSAPLTQLNDVAALVEAQPGWRRIGQILIDLGYLDQGGLDAALAEQYRRFPDRQIGLLDLLVEQGSITTDQARQALTDQIMTQYLPGLAASLQREKQLTARAAVAQQEAIDSYSTALRTITLMEKQIQELSQRLATERAAFRETARAVERTRDRVPRAGHPDRSRRVRAVIATAAVLGLGLFIVFIWTILPALADRASQSFVPWAEPIDGGTTRSSPVPPSSAQVPPAPTAPGETLQLAERELARFINGGRLAHGLAPLTPNMQVSQIARQRSQDMATRDYFSHSIPPDGSTFLGLLDGAGIGYLRAGEVLEFNAEPAERSAQFAAQQLFNSPEHGPILLNPQYDEIGVGVAGRGDRRYYTALVIRLPTP